MTPTWNNTELRVLARRQRELKAKPWLRPVETEPSEQLKLIRSRRGLKGIRNLINDRISVLQRQIVATLGVPVEHQSAPIPGSYAKAQAEVDLLAQKILRRAQSSRVDSITTGRVDRITGTIEIGGRVQEWVLEVAQSGTVYLRIHNKQLMTVSCITSTINIFASYENDEVIVIREAPAALSPDPNFTPPGQYVEANGLKFWVKETKHGISIWMNDIMIFGVSRYKEDHIYIGVHAKRAAINRQPYHSGVAIKDKYSYTGCQCDTCGGGE